MPTQGPSGKPTTRRYSDEERAQAVRLVRQLRKELGTEHGTVKRVADQLGFGVETVRGWMKDADVDAGEKPGTTSVDAARIKELEQEVKELRRSNDIDPDPASRKRPRTTCSEGQWRALTVTSGR